jgi:ABC-type lipoprotein export system ATPase subunit
MQSAPPLHIFEIEHLTCQYKRGVPALRIPALQIRRGELIFVVGISGIGKSTFIETLGLMNNTIAPDENTSIRFVDAAGTVTDLAKVWSGAAGISAGFRKKHFSFIFQHTNLMPNFTAGENVAISMLIQNRSMTEVQEKVISMMERFNLPQDIFARPVFSLSGGQKQRLAFLRAVMSDFDILFGDEPTGNLDSQTAELLMGFLQELLKKDGRTALIVSHDLALSLQFADRIFVITPDAAPRAGTSAMPVGLLQTSHQLAADEQRNWHDHTGQPVYDPLQWLREKLSASLIATT